MKRTSFLLGLQDCKKFLLSLPGFFTAKTHPGATSLLFGWKDAWGELGFIVWKQTRSLFPFSIKLLALQRLLCKARETDRHSMSAVLLHVWSNAADIQIDGTWQLIPKSPLLFVYYFLPFPRFPSQHIQAFLDPPKRAHFFLPGFWSTRLFNSEGTYSWHPRKVGDQQL